jgi:hypothetical protein
VRRRPIPGGPFVRRRSAESRAARLCHKTKNPGDFGSPGSRSFRIGIGELPRRSARGALETLRGVIKRGDDNRAHDMHGRR